MYRAVVIVCSEVASVIVSVFNLAVVDEVPVCIIVCSQILRTVDLVPAVSSPAFLYYVVVKHIFYCCASRSVSVKMSVSWCCCAYCLTIDPLVKHLAMLVEHVVTAIYFLLASILVHLTAGSEPVPTFVVALVLICTCKDLLLILILVSVAWLLKP